MRIFEKHEPDDFVDIPEGACLVAYRGSQAHGMYVPKNDPNHIDDVDIMGVIVGEEANYLGLREWGSRGTLETKRGKWDCVYYEIRKAFSLLLRGNPNVMGLLWTRPQDLFLMDECGQRLVDARACFVGKHVYDAFAGYAFTQLEKMESRDPAELREYIAITNELKFRGIHPNHKGEKIPYPENHDPHHGFGLNARETGDDSLFQRLRHFQKKGENLGYLGDKRKQLVLDHGYDAKNAAHCIRLLRMCKEFLSSGEMIVYRPDAAELLEIKRGQWPLERVKALAAHLFAEIKAAYESSPLPPEPDRAGAERVLIGILRDRLRIK